MSEPTTRLTQGRQFSPNKTKPPGRELNMCHETENSLFSEPTMWLTQGRQLNKTKPPGHELNMYHETENILFSEPTM